MVQSIGPLTYMIQLDDHSLWKRHVDHIRNKVETLVTPSNPTSMDSSQSTDPPFIPFTSSDSSSTDCASVREETSQPTTEQSQPVEQHNPDIPISQGLAPWRNPPRNRHPLQRYQNEQT